MLTVVYADILFFINFSMDFLALFLVGLITHAKICRLRIICASIIGGIFGIFAIIIEIGFITKIISALSVALLMCFICYEARKLSFIILSSSLYIFVSTSLGGIMSVLFSICNKLLADIIINEEASGAFGTARSITVIGLTAIFSIIFTKILIHKKEVNTVRLEVTAFGKTFVLFGLCDTGNLLVEPFSGKRVILVSCESELGKEIDKINDVKKRYIPYKDVNGTGMIKGVFAEKIIVDGKSVNAMLATVKNKSFDGNEALIPSAII